MFNSHPSCYSLFPFPFHTCFILRTKFQVPFIPLPTKKPHERQSGEEWERQWPLAMDAALFTGVHVCGVSLQIPQGALLPTMRCLWHCGA